MNTLKTPIALFGAGAIGRTHLDRLQRRDRVESICSALDALRTLAATRAVLEAAAGAPRASDTLDLPVNEGRNES